MIRVKIVEPATADWTSWKAACESAAQAVIVAVGSRGTVEYDPDLYSGKSYGVRASFFFSLSRDAPFFGKCAYCDSSALNHDGNVEHFRPKKGVKGADGKLIFVMENGAQVQHPGYYWLAYDWRNLLPSCQRCNQWRVDTRSGKANFFPVNGTHATKPGDEAHEKPLLLNPSSNAVDDDPSDHLKLEETGILTPKNMSERGQATIDIFGLNARSLPDDRKKAFIAAKNSISIALLEGRAIEDEEVFKDLRSGKIEHCIAARQGGRQALRLYREAKEQECKRAAAERDKVAGLESDLSGGIV